MLSGMKLLGVIGLAVCCLALGASSASAQSVTHAPSMSVAHNGNGTDTVTWSDWGTFNSVPSGGQGILYGQLFLKYYSGTGTLLGTVNVQTNYHTPGGGFAPVSSGTQWLVQGPYTSGNIVSMMQSDYASHHGGLGLAAGSYGYRWSLVCTGDIVTTGGVHYPTQSTTDSTIYSIVIVR